MVAVGLISAPDTSTAVTPSVRARPRPTENWTASDLVGLRAIRYGAAIHVLWIHIVPTSPAAHPNQSSTLRCIAGYLGN